MLKLRPLILLFALSLPSCSILETGKSILTGTYQAGKIRGRQEIVEELELNKKKLEPLRLVLLDRLQTEDYQGIRELLPILAAMSPLLLERVKLKQELEASKKANASQTL